MKITKKDLIADRKDDEKSSSPCCHSIEDAGERKFYVSVPITEAAITGLVLGKPVTLTVQGSLREVRTRWSPEIEIEVTSIEMTSGKTELEELIDEEDE